MKPDAEEADDLDSYIAECSQDDPGLPARVEAAVARRDLMYTAIYNSPRGDNLAADAGEWSP